MSFKEYRDVIKENDAVILYLGFDNMLTLKLEKGKTHQTRYGAMKHDDVIGRNFGSKIQCANGFLHVLHPTPELWTLNLPHRTQILYATDISMVIMQLDLKPGSVVIESGTGSGSLSHSIIRTIAPTGHLYTFEFHEQRAEKAKDEFEEHEISEYVTVEHRDVCNNGFGKTAVADAVFLDLPAPWSAIPHAKVAMKSQGRICSFSPCIEQVQTSCETLAANGFTDIVTIECLVRLYDVKELNIPQTSLVEKDKLADSADSSNMTKMTVSVPQTVMPGHTGYLTFATLFSK
ncbi:tRNA (adenine(58)-N(1))-methyltransferase catalytic subunit TRMT61A-like [Tubulanus polymorphus]|uniref:tRNA (adenine(58)-N(1))-methyltransferase catalytic subunit TRMT61A-like n=1 Tax=Tubulanus polymorphus TaxID=672921 RepID=UPI003DA3DE3F